MSVQIISQNDNHYDSCHNLSNVGGKVAFASANKAAWHGLGTVVSDAMTSAEALSLGGLANWDLAKLPQHVRVGDNWVDTGSYAVVRQDHGLILTQGTSVGERYTIVSNEGLFDFLDQVMSELGARYETVGALGNGEQVWLMARYDKGSFTLGSAGQDTTDSYLLLQSTHDGSGSIQCYPTSVRVVCNNTLRLAERKANGNECRYAMRHTQNVQRNIAEAIKVLGLASRTFATYAAQAEAMSKLPVNPAGTDGYFGKWIDGTFAESSTEIAGVAVNSSNLLSGVIERAIDAGQDRELRVLQERQLIKARDCRDKLYNELMTRYESPTCQVPGCEGTLWAGFNAVTETVDHSDIMRYRGNGRDRAESRFTSLVSGKGDGWKQIALQVALQYLAG